MDDQEYKDYKADEKVERSVMLALKYLDRSMSEWNTLDVQIYSLRIRSPRDKDDDFLVVLRGEGSSGEKVVAFHGALSLPEAIGGTGARLRNGTLSWKVDQYG
jgi:hypothetical protein